MADVMGAAAGYGMICLILLLITAFLTEIKICKNETLHHTGRVFLCCGLFGIAHYGALVLIRMVLYGMENMNGFMDIVGHSSFAWMYDLPENDAMYAITFSSVMMAVSGCFLYHAISGVADKDGAAKALMLFYLLPGMGGAFMPGWGCMAGLGAAAIIFAVMKIVRPCAVRKMPAWLYGGICVLLALMRGFMLFLWVRGV